MHTRIYPWISICTATLELIDGCCIQNAVSPRAMSKAKANVTAMPVTTGAPKIMSATTEEITEELLQCRLCSTKYRVIGRRPLTLRCAHTFCEICLEHLLLDQMDDDHLKPRRNRRQQLVCPTCDAVTPFGRGCTPSSSLPVNHSVMELLEIFDQPPASSGVRSSDLAPGYSQVKVNTKTSHGQRSAAGGSVNLEPNRPLAALAKSKTDIRNGMDAANRYLSTDGHSDETGTSGPANWVSTVNIGKSSPQQQRHRQKQQQQQQQQQHGSLFSAGKLSSAPAAASSAVTSVSTLKKQPQQSSTTSSGVVLSSDTNAGPTSSAPAGGGHRCCRCGLRPAAVSVASSSRTTTPQLSLIHI